jgi:hypothetical protein
MPENSSFYAIGGDEEKFSKSEQLYLDILVHHPDYPISIALKNKVMENLQQMGADVRL